MNEQTKAQVEAYAEECRTEQLELLRTLGKMPAPTRKDVFKFPDFIHPDPVWLMYPRGKSGTDMGDSDEHRRKRACIE